MPIPGALPTSTTSGRASRLASSAGVGGSKESPSPQPLSRARVSAREMGCGVGVGEPGWRREGAVHRLEDVPDDRARRSRAGFRRRPGLEVPGYHGREVHGSGLEGRGVGLPHRAPQKPLARARERGWGEGRSSPGTPLAQHSTRASTPHPILPEPPSPTTLNPAILAATVTRAGIAAATASRSDP